MAPVVALRAQLTAIAADGMGVSRNEQTQHVSALAVAIRRSPRGPFGTMMIAVPDARFNSPLALGKKTLRTARERIEKASQTGFTRSANSESR